MISSDLAGDTKTVVLVEDDPSTAGLYRNRLQQAGFRTTLAAAGGQPFEAPPNLTADLIIIDLMLPGRRGLQTLEAIRRSEGTADVATFFVSAQDPADEPLGSRYLLATVAEGFTLSRLLDCSLMISAQVLKAPEQPAPAPR